MNKATAIGLRSEIASASTAKTALGIVEFLITAEALAHLLNPDFEGIVRESALETYFEFEADIHRIAHLDFVKRLGGEPPILLTIDDVEMADRRIEDNFEVPYRRSRPSRYCPSASGAHSFPTIGTKIAIWP